MYIKSFCGVRSFGFYSVTNFRKVRILGFYFEIWICPLPQVSSPVSVRAWIFLLYELNCGPGWRHAGFVGMKDVASVVGLNADWWLCWQVLLVPAITGFPVSESRWCHRFCSKNLSAFRYGFHLSKSFLCPKSLWVTRLWTY